MKEDHVFLSNSHVQTKEVSQWGSKVLVEWLSTKRKKKNKQRNGQVVMHKEILYERRPYIFVEWSCADKRIKLVKTLSLGWMIKLIMINYYQIECPPDCDDVKSVTQ